MKMKTILKWIIGLMVINGPFTMESSNNSSFFTIKHNDKTLNNRFKISSLGSLMKKAIVGFTMANFGLSNSSKTLVPMNFNNDYSNNNIIINNNHTDNSIGNMFNNPFHYQDYNSLNYKDYNFFNKDHPSLQTTTSCPSWLTALLPLTVDTIVNINDFDYKIWCDTTNKRLYYGWKKSTDSSFLKYNFAYYNIKYLNSHINFFSYHLGIQANTLYSYIHMFDQLTSDTNFVTGTDAHNNDMLYYAIVIYYTTQDGTQLPSYQYHWAPGYFGMDLTSSPKAPLLTAKLQDQVKTIMQKYKKYNDAIPKYFFYYRSGEYLGCTLYWSSKQYICQCSTVTGGTCTKGSNNLLTVQTTSFDVTDSSGDTIPHTNNNLPSPCPFIPESDGTDRNKNCVWDLNQYTNQAITTCPTTLNGLSNKDAILDELKYAVSCYKTDFKKAISYQITDTSSTPNVVLRTLENTYDSYKFLPNQWNTIAPTNLKDNFLYDGIILFDSSDVCPGTKNDNDIIGYSIALYYLNVDFNVLNTSVQHHLNACSRGAGLTEQQLLEARLNIIKIYKDFNQAVYKYSFYYRGGKTVDYVFSLSSTAAASPATGLTYSLSITQYMFDISGDKITYLTGSTAAVIPSIIITDYITDASKGYQAFCPPILKNDGTDLNVNCNSIATPTPTPTPTTQFCWSCLLNIPKEILNILIYLEKNILKLSLILLHCIFDSIKDENHIIKLIITILYSFIFFNLDEQIKTELIGKRSHLKLNTMLI